MTVPATHSDTMDRALEAVCMLLMPFFMLGAGDDPEKARAAVASLVLAYMPDTSQELDLAARIVGFSAAALDNLRLSMTSPTLSDTKVLRFRSAAINLSRSAEHCRAVLQTMRAEQTETEPSARVEQPVAAQPQAPAAQPRAPVSQPTTAQIEKARNEARAIMAALAKGDLLKGQGQGMTAIHMAPDPGAEISAGVMAAMARHQLPHQPRG
jgi:hypothetical protein